MNELAAAFRELAEPIERGEKINSVIERVARRVGFKKSRVYEAWYGRARRITDDERMRVSEALTRKRREAARNELHELRLRIEKLEARLSQTDEDFHRETIAALKLSVRGGR